MPTPPKNVALAFITAGLEPQLAALRPHLPGLPHAAALEDDEAGAMAVKRPNRWGSYHRRAELTGPCLEDLFATS